MKRIFTYLSVVAALSVGLASCKVDKEATEPTPVVAASDVNITITNVKDSSFTVTVAPQAEAGYYSFLVAKGAAQKVDSVNLFQVKYSGIKQATVNYADNASVSFDIEDCAPNTAYTVYAVAASKAGNIGSVAVKTVTTSDIEAPEIIDWDVDENIVLVKFSEDVEIAETAEATADVYYKCYLTGSAYAKGVKASDISYYKGSSNVVAITFEEIVKPGAFYTVNFAEGTFTDIAGNPAAAVVSSFDSAYDFDKNEFDYTGIIGYLANADLVYELPEIPATVNIEKFSSVKWSVNVPEGISRIDLKDGYVTTYTRISEAESSSSVTVETASMEKLTNYYGTYYDVVVIPAGTPVVNDEMTITIPAGAVRDWWGNVNAKDIVLGPSTVIIIPEAEIEAVSISANKVSYNVTPSESANSMYWIADVYAKGVTTGEDLVKGYVAEIADWAEKDGLTFEEEMATYYAYTGAQEELGAYNLDQLTDCVIYVFFLDKDGNLLGEVAEKEFTTTEFAFPEGITTGTYTYTGVFKPTFGTEAGLPVTFDAATGTVTISNWCSGNCILKATFDESGNGKITELKTPFSYGSYGSIYLTEYYDYNSGSGDLSYIDEVEKCIRFHTVYCVSAGYLTYGWEYFDLDNSVAPSSAASSCKMTPALNADKAPVSKSTMRKLRNLAKNEAVVRK